MKKIVVIPLLIATVFLNTQHVSAESSSEENIGFASGAISGALIAGPIGFMVGAIVGTVLGQGVNDGQELEIVSNQLSDSKYRESLLNQKLVTLESKVESTENQADWMNEGLTFNVMFTSNSSKLSDSDHTSIKQLTNVLNKFPQLTLQLDGYTDPVGRKTDNMKLSQKRINAVKQAFETYGIDSKRVTGNSHGEDPSISIDDRSGTHAMARRVSVNFVEQPANQIAQY